MSAMFQGRMEYEWFDNSWRISGVGEYEAELNIDDWWPEVGELGTVVFDGRDAVGYFYVYTTYNEDHDPNGPATSYPERWPNGEANSTRQTFAEYLGEVLIPVAVRYNRGLLNLANRHVRISAMPGSAFVELNRQDNLGNGGGTAGSAGLARYFVTGETVTLTANATDSDGRPFEAWLRSGADYSRTRSITIAVSSDVTFTAVYTSDADRDGYIPPNDCNDNNFNVHPGATEVCNGIDDNCDGQIDEQGAVGCTTYYRDSDNDGYGLRGDTACLCAPSGSYRATQSGDCDDTRSSVHPGAIEACNGRDDNCDGQTDEPGATGCSVFYWDNDNDGFGLDGQTQCLCSRSGHYRATQGGDCNDYNASVYPGATEICVDQIDNNCNGQADCGDSVCASQTICRFCGDNSCDDSRGETPCTCSRDCGTAPSNEIDGVTCADGIDNDCDGLADGLDPDCLRCGDGSCEPDAGEDSCTCPLDCGIAQSNEFSGATCSDGLDDDCDGFIDCDDTDCSLLCNDVCAQSFGDCCSASGVPVATTWLVARRFVPAILSAVARSGMSMRDEQHRRSRL